MKKYTKSEMKEVLLKLTKLGSQAKTMSSISWAALVVSKFNNIKFTNAEVEEIFGLLERPIHVSVVSGLETKSRVAERTLTAAPNLLLANDMLEILGKEKIKLQEHNRRILEPSFNKVKFMTRSFNLDILDNASALLLDMYGQYSSDKPKLLEGFEPRLEELDKDIEKWETMVMKVGGLSHAGNAVHNLAYSLLIKDNLHHITLPENPSIELKRMDEVIHRNFRDLVRKKSLYLVLTTLQRSLLSKHYDENKVVVKESKVNNKIKEIA